MSDLNWKEQNDRDKELDELLRSSREFLDGETPAATEPEEPEEIQEPSGMEPLIQDTTKAVEFEPDFGSTFGDYGVYEGDQEETESEAPTKKRRWHLKRFRIPTIFKVLIYIALLLVVGYFAGQFAWNCVDDAAALTRPDEEIIVEISDADDLDGIAKTLKTAGAIEYEWLFKLYCKVTKSEHYFDPGVYVIKGSYDYHALVNNLMATAGNRETIRRL